MSIALSCAPSSAAQAGIPVWMNPVSNPPQGDAAAYDSIRGMTVFPGGMVNAFAGGCVRLVPNAATGTLSADSGAGGWAENCAP